MVSRVCECICACQAGCSRTDFKLSALSQASSTISHVLTGQDVFLMAILALVLVAGLVVFPAVWSGKPSRRRAALAVLDRLVRWRL